MSRSIWIPATLLALGAGAIVVLSWRNEAPDSCPACEVEATVADRGNAPRQEPPPAPAPVLAAQPQEALPPQPPLVEDDEKPDFNGNGIELLRTRRLIKLPSREEKVSQEELQARMGQLLAGFFPEGYGIKEGRALTALGAIPAPVDTVEQRAALWAQVLGAWYDPESNVMLLAHDDSQPVQPDHALGQSFAFLMRERGDWLKKQPATGTTDAWLARLSLVAGDAALTSSLHDALPAYKKTAQSGPPASPAVVYPSHHYLQDLEIASFNTGENFVKALYHMGDFDQVNATYQRPPLTTAELLDGDLYFADQQFEPRTPAWQDVRVLGRQPFWDDALGELSATLLLEQQLPENTVEAALEGWRGDRWLAYKGEGEARGQVVWQTYWKDRDAGGKFMAAMEQYLNARYASAATKEGTGALKWSAQERHVILTRTDDGLGVFYADASTPEFVDALWQKLTTH